MEDVLKFALIWAVCGAAGFVVLLCLLGWSIIESKKVFVGVLGTFIVIGPFALPAAMAMASTD